MPHYDQNNIFAKILRKEIPAKIVLEDEYALAFHDINPQAPTHILVIPKGSYTSFDDFCKLATTEEIAGFFRAAQQVCHLCGIQEQGYRILANHGKDANQEVPHFHLHIFSGRNLGKMLL